MKRFLIGLGVISMVAVASCGESETTKAGGSSSDPGREKASPTTPGKDGGETPDEEENVELTEETMEFGGQTRTYTLAKPKSYDEGKTYPLVLSFHGNPGQSRDMVINLPFDYVSKQEAVIAYPQGWGDNWDLYTPTDDNADMNWIAALVDEIKDKKANIDPKRVFGFGYSGGAFFITQMACRFGGFFKAISVNAGGGPDEAQMGYAKYANGCYQCPGGPTPTIVTHGADDGEVEPASGEFTATCFATINGCDGDVGEADEQGCRSYSGCPAKRPVKLCMVPGLGHGPWSEAMAQAWSFFEGL